MSSDSVAVKITKIGNPLQPKFIYNTSNKEIPMGTNDMYLAFISNFSDRSISDNFFSSENGFKLLETMLTVLKCDLYIPNENQDYIQNIKKSFEIIKGFFSTLSNSGRTKEIYVKYSNLIPKIQAKSQQANIKNTVISEMLTNLITFLTSSSRSTVRDVNQILSSKGSIEAARNLMVNFSTINQISNLILSPVNPSVFPDFRNYLKYIGEGNKASNDSIQNFENIKDDLLRVIGLIKKNAGLISLNVNNVSDINNTLIYFLQNPNVMILFIKVLNKLDKLYPENEDITNELKRIWINDSIVFRYTPSDGYIGGTKGRESSIVKEIIVNSKIISSETVEISMKSIKFVMKVLNDGLNPAENQEIKKKIIEIYKAIDKDKYGDIKSDFVLDWWQNLFINKVKNKESFILVGDTSGGKTFVALMGMRIIFNSFLNEPNAKFIYLAPTSQLVVLQFANILTYFPEYNQYFGICCKMIVDIPSTAKIIFGTPIEVKRYLQEVKFHRDTIITLDNLQDNMTSAISNPFINNCKNIIIDEIQTWSPTYVQNSEKEQSMECKAIEEVLSSVSYDRDKQSQVIGLSATLSPESIVNIKNKISSITGIPIISDIIYSHDDIGLSDFSKKHRYIPIMKRPEILPIKIDNKTIVSFSNNESIYQQPLDNNIIEMIVRDATFKEVLPISIYRESELSTIQMFKDFISYLEKANNEANIWQGLYTKYQNELNSNGYIKMRELNQIQKWKNILNEHIGSIIHDVNLTQVLYVGNFHKLIQAYENASGVDLEKRLPILSVELYGILHEWLQFHNSLTPFSKDIHPYYRFGGNNNADNFFNLVDKSTNSETTLKKILVAQDADPNSNVGSIIPLIMRGISFGVGLITSSIPLGFQLEIFKFINIKSKLTGDSSPIPILFGEFGMSMGVNFSTMSVCIMRSKLENIGASEFGQISGRPGRRGNINTRAPIVYTFNINNVNDFLTSEKRFENLDFNVDNIKSNFFLPGEVYEYISKIIVKIENNRDNISQKNETTSDSIISGDCFKGIGGSDLLMIRKNQLSKYQIKELFDTCKNLFPHIVDTQLRELFIYLQKAEFYNLNVQIN